MEGEPGFRFKTRCTAMNAADAEDFSRALLEAYPNVRFVRHPYSEYYVFKGRRADGCWQTERVENQPPNLHVPYVDSMGVPDGGRFMVWLEPEGWEPIWFGPGKLGIYFIINEPKLWFVFGRSREYPHPPDLTVLDDSRIESRYHRANKEHQAFLNKVWRIVAKLTSQALVLHDKDTLEVKGLSERSMLWAGHHAIRWCREDPKRFITDRYKPPEET